VFSSWRTFARPGIGNEQRERFGREPRDLFVFFGGKARHEIFRESGHIFPAVAQRGNQNREYVEPVIEVFAEAALARELGEVAIGGRDDTHIDLDGALGADRIDLAFLQCTQQLDLHVQPQLPDLVEEERAAVGFLKLPEMLVAGPGERPFS